MGQEGEWTVESNPNSRSASLFSMLREEGVNRISLGVQSLDDRQLMTLGRAHTAEDAVSAFAMARHAGFRNIGLDLIYGIPGQDAASWRMTVCRAVELGAEHIAAYALSLDDGSAFKCMDEEGTLSLPRDDEAARLYDIAAELLIRAGYRQYELSNFARPGYECAHNMNYWNRGEYVGLGPGAWSFRAGRRSCNTRDVVHYSRQLQAGLSPVAEEEQLTEEEAAREYLMLRMRTAKGVDLRMYQKLHGNAAFKRLMDNVLHAGLQDLCTLNDEHISLTYRGRLLADQVILRLCS